LISIGIILLNPITFSATSWTIAQSFALTFSILYWGILVNEILKNNCKIVLAGLTLVICFNSNLWAGALNFIGSIVFIAFSNKLNFKNSFRLLTSILISSFLFFELLWRILFGWSQSLWIAHFRTVSRGVISQKGFEEWKSFRELFQNGVIPWTGISLLLMLIIAGAIGLLYIQRLTSNNRLIFNLVIAGGTMSLISLISHLIGVNPQITSFWYFYSHLPA
jgi:hypothetical protein